jgi:phage shock protein A
MFTRMRRILRQNLNELLERAENPARAIDSLVLEMQEELAQAREQVALAMAAEQRLAQQEAEAETASRQWEDRARRALEHSSEDLAREALRRQLASAQLAVFYRNAYNQQAQTTRQLRAALGKLEKRLEEARAKRVKLLAQIASTKAQHTMSRATPSAVGGNAFDAFDRISVQVETDERRAVAMAELSTDDLEDAFLMAEEQEAVEHQLTQLRRELGYAGQEAPKALEGHDDQ